MPGVIKINPDVMNDRRDALAVAWNEALRLFMEDSGFAPELYVTPAQQSFFRKTAYASDTGALKKTIVARIATRDTSIPEPTAEQVSETARLLDAVLAKIGVYHKDAAVVKRMREGLGKAGPAPAGNKPPEPAVALGPEARSDMLGGDVGETVFKKMHEWKADTPVLVNGRRMQGTPQELAALEGHMGKTYGIEVVRDAAVPSNTVPGVAAAVSKRAGNPENKVLVFKAGAGDKSVLYHEFTHLAALDADKGQTPSREEELRPLIAQAALGVAAGAPLPVFYQEPDALRIKQRYYSQAFSSFAEKFGPKVTGKDAAADLSEIARWAAQSGTPGTPEYKRIQGLKEALAGAGEVTHKLLIDRLLNEKTSMRALLGK